MKKIMYWALVLPLTASILLSGCKKDEDDIILPPVINNPVEGKTLVASATSDDANLDIKIYADKDLFVGYNKIYTLLYEKGTMKEVNNATVTYHPLMNMISGMSHTCPTENPAQTNPADGLFEGAAIFIMPTGDMGSWKFGVQVKNLSNNLEGEVDFNITVEMPTDPRVFSFESPVDTKKIFITLAEPSTPKVGMNDLIVMAHFKESMSSFPAIENLNIEFEPTMPSMGHGSPNNENPVHMSNGHYEGVVNFTMSGYWRLDMTIMNDESAVLDDTHSFDVNF